MNDKKQELIAKALKDPKFKAELLANPKAAIEKSAGVKIPGGLTIKIVEDTATVVHLVLPSAAGKAELSDRELQSAAGGALPATMVMYPCDNNNTSYELGKCK